MYEIAVIQEDDGKIIIEQFDQEDQIFHRINLTEEQLPIFIQWLQDLKAKDK